MHMSQIERHAFFPILGRVKLLVLYAPAFSGSTVWTTDFAIEHRETARQRVRARLLQRVDKLGWSKRDMPEENLFAAWVIDGFSNSLGRCWQDFCFAVQCTPHSRFSLTLVESWHIIHYVMSNFNASFAGLWLQFSVSVIWNGHHSKHDYTHVLQLYVYN